MVVAVVVSSEVGRDLPEESGRCALPEEGLDIDVVEEEEEDTAAVAVSGTLLAEGGREDALDFRCGD